MVKTDRTFLPNTAGGLVAETGVVVRLLELEATVLGSEELKETDCGAGVSTAENLMKEQTYLLICMCVCACVYI